MSCHGADLAWTARRSANETVAEQLPGLFTARILSGELAKDFSTSAPLIPYNGLCRKEFSRHKAERICLNNATGGKNFARAL